MPKKIDDQEKVTTKKRAGQNPHGKDGQELS
jgi:hypothetical protein